MGAESVARMPVDKKTRAITAGEAVDMQADPPAAKASKLVSRVNTLEAEQNKQKGR